MRLEWDTYQSPIGPLSLVEAEEGPLVVEFPARTGRIPWAVRSRGGVPEVRATEGGCIATRRWLDAYFGGGRIRRYPFPSWLPRWLEVSPAQMLIFRALRAIPPGETRSYDDLARATGLHPRQIGQLVGSNHRAILVPCHRVVGKDGSLVGYSGGLRAKKWLLDHELRGAGVVLR
jgi:methylated-DNA-[protein]-cysteine S-methyltransferase